MTPVQFNQIIEGQKEILDEIKKLTNLLEGDPLRYLNTPVLNTYEAAKLLNISHSTLQEACLNRELPCRKIGNTYIFNRDVLVTWMNLEEPKVQVEDSIDTDTAAILLGVSAQKLRQWAKAYNYYKIPVIREGYKFFYDETLLLEWAKSPVGKELIEVHQQKCIDRQHFIEEAQKRYEADRLEKEAKKKAQIERKLSLISKKHI